MPECSSRMISNSSAFPFGLKPDPCLMSCPLKYHLYVGAGSAMACNKNWLQGTKRGEGWGGVVKLKRSEILKSKPFASSFHVSKKKKRINHNKILSFCLSKTTSKTLQHTQSFQRFTLIQAISKKKII